MTDEVREEEETSLRRASLAIGFIASHRHHEALRYLMEAAEAMADAMELEVHGSRPDGGQEAEEG